MRHPALCATISDGQADDLNRAIELLGEAVGIDAPDMTGLYSNLGTAYQARYELTGSGTDLADALDMSRRALAAARPDHSRRPVLAANLAMALLECFSHHGKRVRSRRGDRRRRGWCAG